MDILEFYKKRDLGLLSLQVEELKKRGLQLVLQQDVELFSHATFSLFLVDSPLLDDFISLPIEDLKYESDTWDWIRPLILLKVRMGRTDRQTKNKVWEAFDIGDEKRSIRRKSVFKRFLNGETIQLDRHRIEEYKNEKQEDLEAFSRITLAMDLVVISGMGAGEEFTVDDAEEIFRENKIQFQELYSIRE